MERISTFDLTGVQSAARQLGEAVSALLSECSLLLPDFVRAQIEDSLLRALGEEAAARTVQLGIHLSEAQPPSAGDGPPRWGFFLVQRREDSRMVLDVHLYQE